MADPARTMFNRDVDFKLEETFNGYAACRGLSQRARHVNALQMRATIEAAEGVESEPNPTVCAFNDYSQGRIVFSNDEDETAE